MYCMYVHTNLRTYISMHAGLTAEHLKAFIPNFLSQLQITALAFGNVSSMVRKYIPSMYFMPLYVHTYIQYAIFSNFSTHSRTYVHTYAHTYVREYFLPSTYFSQKHSLTSCSSSSPMLCTVHTYVHSVIAL